MEDRELLEMAAKAAGLPVEFFDDGFSYEVNGYWPCGRDEGGDVIKYWNPLINDGDALRLSVSLNLDVCFYRGHQEVGVQGEWMPEPVEANEPYSTDILAATRRAIVRAAAEIGRAMS